MLSLRLRYVLASLFTLTFISISSTFYHRSYNATPPIAAVTSPKEVLPNDSGLTSPALGPKYKPKSTTPALQIHDNFPLFSSSNSPPPIPAFNAPPSSHVPENTPLFIGFTRNWRVLQQVVVSYITSGWPAEDIYVVENTGVIDSNARGLLSLQNPFFLNHTRLELLGVNVLVTPTLLTFAQLQNYYIWTATEKGWATYFWSHMDVVAVSYEEVKGGKDIENPPTPEPWQLNTIYQNCLHALRNVTSSSPTPSTALKDHTILAGPRGVASTKPWATIFFSYDRLALVNVAAYKSIGGWDTLIPFYMTDCDMHSRITMGEYEIYDWTAGLVYDVGSSVEDLEVYYRVAAGPGEVREVEWVDLNGIEEEKEKPKLGKEGKSKKGGKRSEGQEKDREHLAWDLAALFPPSTAPLSKPPNLNPRPSENYSTHLPSSPPYHALLQVLDRMQNSKNSASAGRNHWQVRQSGGQGEPFYRDPEGFEKGILMTIEHGRAVYREKWGHRDCDIYQVGLRSGDAWRVVKDWE